MSAAKRVCLLDYADEDGAEGVYPCVGGGWHGEWGCVSGKGEAGRGWVREVGLCEGYGNNILCVPSAGRTGDKVRLSRCGKVCLKGRVVKP